MRCSFPARSKSGWIRNLTGLFIGLLLAGCAASSTSPPPARYTLLDIPGLPKARLAGGFKPSEWERWTNLHCTGHVVLDGAVREDGTIANLRVTDSHPDHARDSLAVQLSEDLRVSAVTIGSRVPPKARIYVIFYETPPIRTAMVFGIADDTIAPTGVQGGSQQLLLRSY